MQPGLVSPVFVGRGAELSSLVAGLQSAVAGEPVVVLVGGEAGVGKTRLVEEVAARVRAEEARLLTGRCIEVGGEGLPLSPVVDVLRSLMRQMGGDELADVLGPARIDLARLLPELDPRSPPTSAAPAGPEGNARVLELVFGVIERLAADLPLMLVIEDLHWADRSTLDLVALLVRALRDARVLLVGGRFSCLRILSGHFVIRATMICMTMLSFRVPDEDAAEVQRWAEALGIDRSEILRDALHRHLVVLSGEADAERWRQQPATDAERSLEAVADWGPAEDWSDWADAAG